MKLDGQNLDMYLAQYDISRRKGEADTDLRKRAMKRFKKEEDFMPYCEMKVGRTANPEPSEGRKAVVWETKHWDLYRDVVGAAVPSEVDAIVKAAKQTPIPSSMPDTDHEFLQTSEVSIMREEYQQNNARCYEDFQKAIYAFYHGCGNRWPRKVILHTTIHNIISPIIASLDRYSHLKVALSKIKLYSTETNILWSFEI